MDQTSAVVEKPVLFEPGDAAVQMQRAFKRAARRLRKNHHLREDIVQEMSLVVLRCRNRHSLAYFLKRAIWKAIKFLKRWERNEKLNEELDREDERLTYDPEVLYIRREAAIAEIKRRGFGFLLLELAKLDAKARAAAYVAA